MPKITIELSLDDVSALRDGMVIQVNGAEAALLASTPPAAARSYYAYMESLASQMAANRQTRTAETYRAALASLQRFVGAADLDLAAIDGPLVEDYQRYLQRQGVTMNTISFYMRILRAAYNRAVDEGLVADARPFRHVYTGEAKTRKRAISIDAIRAIRDLRQLPADVAFARDMFLFSFYTRGMSFVDMAWLRPSNIVDGRLAYRRAKTGQLLSMEWDQRMQQILDRHPAANPDFLLPIIARSNGCERSQYRNVQYRVNTALKQVAKAAGLDVKLTMYVARHSWATAARTLGVPMDVISHGMGHDSEKTTRIYLKSLDTTAIDDANRQVMDALR